MQPTSPTKEAESQGRGGGSWSESIEGRGEEALEEAQAAEDEANGKVHLLRCCVEFAAEARARACSADSQLRLLCGNL
jgi:hypothetical protein